MFKFNAQRSLAIGILGLSAAAFPSLTYATHSWGGYHWARASNSFTLTLGDNVSAIWDSYLNKASSDWSTVPSSCGLFLNCPQILSTVVGPVTNNDPKTCNATPGKVVVCNASYGNRGWLGIAQIWLSGLHITKGTVKMNDTYFKSGFYNTSAWKQMVMCQEIGHTFGLDHQDTDFYNANLGTCMDYTNDPSSNQYPNAHDYEELGIIYSHLDSTTTVAPTSLSPSRVNGKPAAHNTSAVANEIDTSNPAEWGMLVSSTHGGWVETYERDLGANHKLVTFVIWAK